MLRSALLVAAGICACDAFYLPGVAPKQFLNGDKVPVKVNKLVSVKTQLPYEYYSLPVCQPPVVEDAAENLGEVLAGDTIENSLYELNMNKFKFCSILCKKTYSEADIKAFQERIDDDYRVHWIIDNLPNAIRVYDEEDPTAVHYERGFPLGIAAEDPRSETKPTHIYYLYNHIRFNIKIHTDPASFEGHRVVGFEVEPFSIKHKYESWPSDPAETPYLETCNDGKRVDHTMNPQDINSPTDVVWTYDVMWESSPVKWASRWDVFLKGSPDDQIHWFSIINSLMIVLFLTGMLAMIMMRTLHKDIAKYNEEVTAEEAQEETGWKLVHGDVFRPPRFSPILLSVCVGTGVQVFMMVVALMFFACLGFLSPANRGGLMTAMLLLFVFCGCFAGYYSARMYKMFGGKQWKRNTLLTAMLYPGVVFAVFFVLNLFVWHEGSSGAVPFGTLFALLVLWFGISVPLAFLGSYFGFKKEEIKNPTRFNQIPRQIPEQAWYMHPIFSILVGGILPFGAVFIELFFIMSALWLSQVYYVFGFLLIVLVILVVTCAEITIVMCYFQLCSEDYNWWWRAFLTSGSSALYLFLYSILYFVTRLDMTKFTAGFLYFTYMWIISATFFLLTGTVGFLACFWFVRKIYAAIKVD